MMAPAVSSLSAVRQRPLPRSEDVEGLAGGNDGNQAADANPRRSHVLIWSGAVESELKDR
jgi:hypothetical protein